MAVSDPTGVLATPLEEVLKPNGRKGMGTILALVREFEADRVIVGLPLGLTGADTDQTREAREFAAVLEKRLGDVPVELYDERFTTILAQRDGGGEGARASEDSRAAAHLLACWLDRRGEV